jgi:transglutaminase-like putative cysteine protease
MTYRLTITAAVAVILASFSLFAVIQGAGWLYAGAGAVIVVAAAGLATRLSAIPAAAVAAGLVLIAVAPLLAWHSWWVRIGGLAVVALVASSAATRRVLPALADVGTYVAALLIYLTVVFGHAQAAGWIIPTARSMRHLGHIASLGYAEHTFAPPVPSSRGLELIAAAGVGLIAILTDLLAVRLRSPAVAGLPLLVLFSVPVATNVKHPGVGLTLSFCLGITGYLALLAADGRERLRLWGRLVTVWQEAADDETTRGPDTRELAASGRRIGLAAVALAVVFPLVVPGLKEHGLFGKNPTPGHGSLAVKSPAPLVQMRSQLLGHSAQPVLTYHTDALNPPQQYLQVFVLNYDNSGRAWTLMDRNPSTSIGSAALRPAPGLSADTSVATTHTSIKLGNVRGYSSSLSYLPVPYAPQFLHVPGSDWQETNSTLMVYGFRPDAGLSYSVTSKTADPTQAQLASSTAKIPADVRHTYTSYTGPNKSKLLHIAQQETRGAHTAFTKALALQNWFTQPGTFTYALRGDLPTSLLQFLTTNKRGFCQQFAFAMAVLARLIGIPSRIAVGYTAGARTSPHNWKVTTADAHAWPELYFPGAGWLRFEPTPGAAAQGTATRPQYAAPTPGGAAPVLPPPGATGPTSGPTGPASGTLGRIRPPTTGDQAAGGARDAAGSPGFPFGLLAVAIIGLMIIAPGLSRQVIRRRRWLASGDSARAHAAWRELTSDLVDHGLHGPGSESPRGTARRVDAAASLDEPARQALGRIAAAEERARYATTPADGASLHSDSVTVRRAMARNASLPRRWRARLLPASTLGPVLRALRQAPDAFGWLDAAGLRFRRTFDEALPGRSR